MYVLGLDFETSGLCPKENRVIEVGAVVWDTDKKKCVATMNHLVNGGIVITDEITEITGITNDELEKFGVSPGRAFNELMSLYNRCEYVVAHNGLEFDKKFFLAELERNNIIDNSPKLWIDTMIDLDFAKSVKHKNLTYLAAVHEFVNPFPHRAFADALTMLKVMSHYPFDDVVKSACEPLVTLEAQVGFANKDLAKNAGYYYEANGKKWLKKIKKHKVAEAKKVAFERGFAVCEHG